MSSTLNSTSLSKEALAFSVSRTSNCLSDSGLALTFTLMAMPGALSRPRSEFGAPGLSKDRSFTYCASTLSVGCCWVALPLPLPAFFSLSSAMSPVPVFGPSGPEVDSRGWLSRECRQDKFPAGFHAASALRGPSFLGQTAPGRAVVGPPPREIFAVEVDGAAVGVPAETGGAKLAGEHDPAPEHLPEQRPHRRQEDQQADGRGDEARNDEQDGGDDRHGAVGQLKAGVLAGVHGSARPVHGAKPLMTEQGAA